MHTYIHTYMHTYVRTYKQTVSCNQRTLNFVNARCFTYASDAAYYRILSSLNYQECFYLFLFIRKKGILLYLFKDIILLQKTHGGLADIRYWFLRMHTRTTIGPNHSEA